MVKGGKSMNPVSLAELHKEIDLIQECINRMAHNSFQIKSWLVALFTVVLALLPERVNGVLLGVVMVSVTGMLWYLDGFFLKTERDYRAVYDWVLEARPAGDRKLQYQLNVKAFREAELVPPGQSIWRVMWSPTLRAFYGLPMTVSLVYLCVQLV